MDSCPLQLALISAPIGEDFPLRGMGLMLATILAFSSKANFQTTIAE